ncbi:hypothetical protein B0J12DRAFT_552422, partial [Macrophomina phaseolina]
SYAQIAAHTGFTLRQVQTACAAGHPTPQHRRGRRRRLTKQQSNQLEVFVCSSRSNRLLSYFQLAHGPFASWRVGEGVIRRALAARGFQRYVAR